MDRSQLPLNALRAFEASARHLNFTRAAQELCVTQAAISHQVKGLEARLGVTLFRRMSRGLVLTDEGQTLLPVLSDTLDRLTRALSRYDSGAVREVLSVGVVGTFALQWLLPRLAAFREAHPLIDLRMLTHNNVVDLASEGLDVAIRFGDGDWPGLAAEKLLDAPMAPLCAPQVAARLEGPRSLIGATLLRSYRAREWPAWFEAAGLEPPQVTGPVFDSLVLAMQAAMQGFGVAMGPPAMFQAELRSGQLRQPFATVCDLGGYWLTWLRHRPETGAMAAFRSWCTRTCAA
jgi:LysR family transcriptional regulator of beta-lactamase